jgi:thiol:disulfide interchange protein
VVVRAEPSPGIESFRSPPSPRSKQAPVRSIPWEPSESAGRERAARRRLPYVIFASADWHTASYQMDREVWTHPAVTRFASAFVWIRLDLTETEGDSELYAQRYALQGVPSTLVFDATGHRVHAAVGFQSADDVARALASVSE